MATAVAIPNNDVAMLSRIIQPQRGDLSVSAARCILKLDFEPSDHDRMKMLLDQAKAGELTASESEELEDYERVGHLLDLLHAKARRTLKQNGTRS